MEQVRIKELKCPACGGKLALDPQNPNIEICQQCQEKYTIQWNRLAETGQEEASLKPLTRKIAYEPVPEVKK